MTKYLETKNRFSNTNEYLAIVKDDGLWIKEEIEDSIYIIHAQKFDNNELKSITSSEMDNYFDNKNTISLAISQESINPIFVQLSLYFCTNSSFCLS